MPGDPSELEWTTKKVLIIGRAAPEPSKKHIETVCTGGITDDGQLLRLYPIPLRYLASEKKYKQWAWVEFAVQKNLQDKRKESYKVREDSIRVLGAVRKPSEKFSLLRRAIAKDQETLIKLYRQDWTSIGIVEVELVNFSKRLRKKNWEKDKPYIKQFHLYTDVKPLEQAPIEFRLEYRCKNNPQCRGHASSLIGWEYMEAFRQYRMRYGSSENAFEKMKEAIVARFNDPSKNAYVLLGTHHRYGSWMVAQLYFFEKNLPAHLF
jgi:hypothetical protein